jgi:very-short-patch-repair endonuclease
MLTLIQNPLDMYVSDNQIFDFYFNAREETVELAKELRKNMTPAEEFLWGQLRNRKFLGLKFRRQHPVEVFVVDFICIEKYLVVEVDGEIHQTPEQKEWDENRAAEIEKYGLTILRFTNEEVIHNTDKVLQKIKEYVLSYTSPPNRNCC